MRLEVIGNYRGTDGLRIRDLPDLVVDANGASWSQLPAKVVVRPELSKTGRAYFSFIGEGATYISDYLNERLRDGEEIGPDTDVFHPKTAVKSFVLSKKVSQAMRAAIDKAGFDFRPYNLRCFFDTQTLLAESKGKIAHDYRVFWMGHTGSIENRYTTNKGRLPKELVEDMRSAYHRAEAFLSVAEAAKADSRMGAFVRLMLEVNSIPTETIDKLESDGELTPEKALEVLREAGVGRKASIAPTPPSRPGEQKLVPAADVEAWLNAGWSGKFAVGDRVMLEGAAPSQ